LLDFLSIEEERMFIKLLLNKQISNNSVDEYSLDNYMKDFRNLCEFIFKEMIKHKFINKFDVQLLGREFISSLLILQIEIMYNSRRESEKRSLLKQHVDFFWGAVKK
jgi:hypothetical protein